MSDFAQLDTRSEDYQSLVNEQLKFQPFYESFGRQPPRPLYGENADRLNRRMLSDVKKYAPEYQNVDLWEIDRKSLNVIEPKMMDAAVKEINSPTRGNPDGSLREVKTLDATGRPTIKFCGSPSSWLDMFKPEPRRLVGIRTETIRGFIPSNLS